MDASGGRESHRGVTKFCISYSLVSDRVSRACVYTTKAMSIVRCLRSTETSRTERTLKKTLLALKNVFSCVRLPRDDVARFSERRLSVPGRCTRRSRVRTASLPRPPTGSTRVLVCDTGTVSGPHTRRVRVCNTNDARECSARTDGAFRDARTLRARRHST